MNDHPKILKMTVGRCSPLGADITVDIAEKTTLLVGKNASGKSLLFESLFLGMSASVGGSDIRDVPAWPGHFSCSILWGGEEYVYSYTCDVLEASELTKRSVTWSEKCQCRGKTVWQVEGGCASFSGHQDKVYLPDGVGLLMIEGNPHEDVKEIVKLYRRLFGTYQATQAGLPRSSESRCPLHLVKVGRDPARPRSRLSLLTGRIVALYEHKPALFEQLNISLQRVAGVKLEVIFYHRDHQESEIRTHSKEYADLIVGDHNIGLASDGTLRTIELLLALVLAEPGVLITIEEPETGIHPHMLDGLLNEIDSSSLDCQVLLSTHSLQVLDWAKDSSESVRLVERINQVTRVRSLSPAEILCAEDYLQDEGTFGDYIFCGGIDDESL